MKQLFATMLTTLLLTTLCASVWAQTATQAASAQANPGTDIPIRPQSQSQPQANTKAQPQANNQAQPQVKPQTSTQVNPQATAPGNAVASDINSGAKPEGPPWYQVEVILFAQADSFRNEANLKSVKLAYPANRVFLQSPDASLDPELVEKLDHQDAQLLTVLLPEDKLKRRDPAQPQAFVPLDSAARLLNPEASTMERSGTYQVLFHEAWMQPMQGARATPWLIVQGGKKIGDHNELEGSLRFFMDSHLNVQANLWRTRFGQPQQEGVNPVAETLVAEPLTSADGTIPSTNPTANQTTETELPETAQWPELPPAPQPPKAGLPAVLASLIDTSDLSDDSSTDDQEQTQTLLYTVEDIDMFEHSQRINSRDLHYLDHPRLGMLIRLTPWVPPGMEVIDEPTEDSIDGEDAQIIDEMNMEEGTNDAPLGDDEARD